MTQNNRQHQPKPYSRTRMQGYVRRAVIGGYSHELHIAADVTSARHSNHAERVNEAIQAMEVQPRRVLDDVINKVSTLPVIKSLRFVLQPEFVMVAVVLLGAVIPLVNMQSESGNYNLHAAQNLLTPTPNDLKSKLKYDTSKQVWLFNQNAAEQLPGSDNNSVAVGGLAYSAQLPVDLSASSGLSITDAKSKLGITLKPQFLTRNGQMKDGHIVYPLLGGKSQLVYTFKQNGIKEDIVLYHSPGDTAEYNYDLQLPTGMEAKLQKDGSVGIFGGDPTLFGNISYGSDKDKALVDKARQNSAKTHLYYEIPAPTISGSHIASVKAQFAIDGSKLTVKVSGLNKAHYPLSIDPSFVMDTTGCSWQSSGNNEDNISYGSCQISRQSITGGAVGSWANNANDLPATTSGQTIVNNGYVYHNSSGSGIYYATINATTGVIGSFAATTGWTSRSTASMVAYNGYIYAIGGINGTTILGTTQVAKPNANGTITSWSTLSSTLNTARFSGGVAAYNNHIYIAGGCSALSGACTTVTGSSEYATVLSDGSLSSWTPTATLTPAEAVPLTVYNGYVYAIGGSNATGATLYNTTYYAAIKSDGSLNTWQASSTLPVNNGAGFGVAHEGYMYYLGGSTASNVYSNVVYVAKIYADGSVGPYQTTASMLTNHAQGAAFAYSGRLYYAGGCVSGTSCSTKSQKIEVATISTTLGAVGPFKTNPNNLVATGGSMSAATAIYGGYMYLLGGGDTTGSNFSNRVLFAKLNSDGTTGTWTTTNSFTDARTNAAAAAYNGYLYVAGGQASSATTDCVISGTSVVYCRDIQKAPINSDGTVGTWVSAGGYYAGAGNPGRDGLGMTAYNGYMYVIGGNYNQNSSVSTEVDVAPINSDGTVGTWVQNASALGATGHSNFQLAQFGKYVYIAGGRLSGNITTSTVVYASLSSAGGMSAWASAGSDFTTARTNNYAATYNGYLYIAAGFPGTTGVTGYSDVQYAKIDTSTGALSGGWTTSSVTLATSRTKQGGGMYNGYLYITGGCNNNALFGGCNTILNDVQVTSVYNGGGGADGTWASAGADFATGRFMHATLVMNGNLYVSGGCKGTLSNTICSAMTDTTYFASLNANGTIGSWTAGTNLPSPIFGHQLVTSGGYVFVVGGCTAGSCSTAVNTVQSALICTGSNNGVGGCGATAGMFGTWNTLNSFTTARWGAGATIANGYLYLAGGCSSGSYNCGTSSTALSDVQSALICTGSNSGVDGCSSTAGTVGTWHGVGSGSSFTNARYGVGLVAYGDYMYLLGGSLNTNFYSTVEFAQIQSTGQLGAWQQTTGMQMVSPYFYGAYNGYIYGFGSATSTDGQVGTNQLQYAPVLPSGQIGSWTSTAGYTGTKTGRYPTGTIYNGQLYKTGGIQFSGSTTRGDTEYAGLLSTPQIAHYSLLFTTDAVTQPASYITSVTPEAGKSSINTALSTATTTSGFTYVAGDTAIQANKKYQFVNTTTDGGTAYTLLITLDDSASFYFGESSTAGSSLSYIKFNYHPNSAMRLRGGKTFNSNVLQSLDAP